MSILDMPPCNIMSTHVLSHDGNQVIIGKEH